MDVLYPRWHFRAMGRLENVSSQTFKSDGDILDGTAIKFFSFGVSYFPDLEADSGVKPEEINSQDDEGKTDGNDSVEGKKKNKKEKVGFRDRKVIEQEQ